MKKRLLILLSVFFLISVFTFSSAATATVADNTAAGEEIYEDGDDIAEGVVFVPSKNDVTAQIEVISKNNVVKTYDIITNNQTFNARDTVQIALRYARNNSSETDIYTVRLPLGTYSFYSSLDIYSNTVFDLGGSTVNRAGSCAALIRFGTKNSVSYGYNGYKNITIKNGVFDSRYIGNTSLIRFAHAYNVVLDNLIFKNTKDVQHQLTFAACNKVRVTNCKFLNMKITEKLEKYNCEAIQIDILKEGNFNYPAYDGTPTKDVVISNCTFDNVQRGVGTHSAYTNHYFDSIQITNNTFSNISGYAINAVNYINSVISNNVITNCGSGINCSTVTNEGLTHFYGPLNKTDTPVTNINVKISNNTISLVDNDYNHVAYGINILGKKITNFTDKDGKVINGDYRISGVSVTNNTIKGNVSKHNFYGIQIEGAYSPEANDKSITVVLNNKITVSSNDSSAKTNYGIRALDCTNVNINNNDICDTGKVTHLESGIRLESSSGCYISGNAITNTTSFGIKLTDCKNSVLSLNKLNKTASDGIYVFSGCNSITINDNSINSPLGNGIYVRDSKLTSINNNKIYSPKNNGIYLTGTAYAKSINTNIIINLKNHGIYFNKSASASTVYGNKMDLVSKNAVGIYLIDNASVKKINNNIINAKEAAESKKLKVICKSGITVNSKSCSLSEIKNNKVKECSDGAIIIYAVKSGAKPVVSQNTLTNTGKGIYISGSTVCSEISSNYICAAKDHGIYLNKKASVSAVKKNTVDLVSKKINGIYITNDASAESITGNIINAKEKKGSKDLKVTCYTGIKVNSSSCNLKEIKNNTVKQCSNEGISVSGTKKKAKVLISGNTITKSNSGIYVTNAVICSSISSNFICGGKNHGIYLNKTAVASSISDNIIDITNKNANAIYIVDSASVKKINNNVINAKEKKESKNLKVNCNIGININSKKCNISEIKGNTVKKCTNAAICIYNSKTKPVISKNTVANAPYGIRYKKATLKSNTYVKCSKAKYKKL